MSTTTLPRTESGPSAAARRFGYLVAIVINAVMLWVAHQLLEWGWPAFLTASFEDVLPFITASLIVSMVVNAVFLVRDRGRVKPLGDLVNTAFGVAVGIQMLAVFPFDFSGYSIDWTGIVRVLLVLGIVGMVIAVVVNLVKLVTGDLPITARRPVDPSGPG